jgi:membrane protease YdiL (CAAX protease family)
MNNEPFEHPETEATPELEAAPSLWTDRSRIWIVGLIFMLLAGNVFFQIQAYLMGGGLILPVLAGQIFGVFIPLLVLSSRNRWNPVQDFQLGSVPWVVPVVAVVLALATLVPASLLAELSMRIFPSDPERIAMFQNSLPRSGLGILLTIITVVFVGPLGEEIVFRGLLHRLAAGFWDPVKGTVLASLIFALVHAEPWLLLGLLAIGVALSFLYQVTGSLLACWIFHAVHNGVALVMMYSADEVQIEPTALSTGDLLWLAISLVVWAVVGSWLLRIRRPQTQD